MIDNHQIIPGVDQNGISEKFPLDGSRSLYGATKLASELMIIEYLDMYEIKGVINRCGVISGPWQMGKVDQGIFTFWMLNHYFKKELNYFGYNGKGKQVRDLLHISDLFRLIDLQIHNLANYNGKIYNVGGGPKCSLSLVEATKLCQKITGNRLNIGGMKKPRVNDIKLFISDNKKVNNDFDWYLTKTPEEILTDIFSWINDNEKIIKRSLLNVLI